MINVECLPIDFGRTTQIFVTKSIQGQYYYAKNNDQGVIEWVRQVHESEAEPYFVCTTNIAKLIVEAINSEQKNATTMTIDNSDRKVVDHG